MQSTCIITVISRELFLENTVVLQCSTELYLIFQSTALTVQRLNLTRTQLFYLPCCFHDRSCGSQQCTSRSVSLLQQQQVTNRCLGLVLKISEQTLCSFDPSSIPSLYYCCGSGTVGTVQCGMRSSTVIEQYCTSTVVQVIYLITGQTSCFSESTKC